MRGIILKKNIQRLNNNFINIFLISFISIAILGSSAEILPFFNELGPTGIYVTDLMVFLIVIACLLHRQVKKLFSHIYYWGTGHSRILITFIFLLVVLWQFYVVESINGKTLWDANMILNNVVNFHDTKSITNEYLSVYPNNVLLFLYERGVWLLLNKPGIAGLTVALSRINILLIDSSLIFCGLALRNLFNKRTAQIYLLLALFLMGLSPWIAVPYSDIWSFFFSSIAICLTIWMYRAQNRWSKICPAFLLAFVVTGSYFMKPSLIIFYIAAGIVAFIAFLAKKKSIGILSLATLSLTTIILIFSFSTYQKNISFLQLNDNRALSIMHFAAMGSINKGAYNQADYYADKAIKNPEKRTQHDIKTYKRRIKGYKNIGNYQRFLVRKHVYNTADGTFNWSGNGIKILFDQDKGNFAQKLFTTEKISFYRHTLFSFPIQIVWVVTLILILFSVPNQRLFTQILKYSLIGFFFFLLIFEGGKSRYMIQLLPFIISLASIGGNELFYRASKLRNHQNTISSPHR
ncbi:hypothetical protein IV43_GL001687 [Ligilactobacillus acidipiscis]|uniref:Integral membrane protein n=1 Tax=Ligilactobacillus acidipiscis TaxID=89059 RepID=A0A0R2JXW3_9LACO|nr:hypothetical protein IV43_GL001687 [Ligilactobacillus acidipiscis]